MAELKVVLRYFPVGDVAGPARKITAGDLSGISRKYGVTIGLDEVKGKNASFSGDNIREETMNSTVEEVSQSAITVTSADEGALRKALEEIIRIYRAPRTVFGSWGSDPRGKQILAGICEAGDGWR
jgi:hypothetical protein